MNGLSAVVCMTRYGTPRKIMFNFILDNLSNLDNMSKCSDFSSDI